MSYLIESGIFLESSGGGSYILPSEIFYSAPTAGSTNISATLGTLALAGLTASVKKDLVIAATNGVLALSGQTASIKKDWMIQATTGTLMLNGKNIALYLGGVLQGSQVRWIQKQASRVLGLLGLGNGPFNSRNR